MTADYQSGDVSFVSGQGGLTGGETVGPASVSVSVVTSAPESRYGQALTFTATIGVATAGLPAPMGTIQFEAGGNPFGAPVAVVDDEAVSFSTSTLPAGSDSITAVYSGDTNFAANTGSFSQTVDQAPLTVTADDQSMVYGASVPSLTYTIVGFVNGDTASVVSGSPSLTTVATSASGVGGYSITITAGSLAAANYDFTDLVNGTLTISPAPLTVTADDQTMIYGASVPDLGYTITGFVNGQTAADISGTPGLSATATSSSPVGNYHIAVSVAGLSATNYRFTGQSGTLTINKAHLTLTADAESKHYGAAVPTLGYTITGFLNGDSANVVSGAAALSTAVSSSNGVGSYPITITAGTLAAANYDFPNLVNSTLSITTAPLTIEVINESRLLGQPNPAITVSYVGFVNGDGPSSLTSPPVASLTTNVTTSSPAGVYPIAVSGASSPNYTITFVGGTLTVISPPLVHLTSVVEKTNKNHQVTEVFVIFSGAVNMTEADSVTTYRLATPGKKGSYTAKNAGIIKLRSAVYNESADTVALTPKKPFALTKPVQLLVNGIGASGLHDAEGLLIDGDHNGTAGGNAIAILSKKSVTIDAVEQAQTQAAQPTSTAIIDALLANGELADLRRAVRARREERLAGGGMSQLPSGADQLVGTDADRIIT